MKASSASFFSLLLPVAGLLLAAGCSLPQPQADPTRFYVLSNVIASVPPQAGAPVVHLRPVELANYLRARPLVVRRGDNEIEFREFARWGEPLEMGIARVLREELLARGAARAVLAAGVRREHASDELNLTVRVRACEGNVNGSVTFRAIWELSSATEKDNVIAGGDYRAGDLRWDGKSEASLAAKLSEAVAGLAAEISAALPKKG